jgi:hypothetical protein
VEVVLIEVQAAHQKLAVVAEAEVVSTTSLNPQVSVDWEALVLLDKETLVSGAIRAALQWHREEVAVRQK